MLLTVVELPTFLNAARRCLSADEIAQLIFELAANPEAGDLIQGTGGVRKLRWAVGAKGKSGGTRVIYFFHPAPGVPLFLLTVYRKSRQESLSGEEKNTMRALTHQLVAAYRSKK